MKSLTEIHAHKARLAERIANQRARVAGDVAALAPLFSAADRGIAVVRSIRAHPEWVAIAAAVLFVLRPRRALALARRGFTAWRTWKWAKIALVNAVSLI